MEKMTIKITTPKQREKMAIELLSQGLDVETVYWSLVYSLPKKSKPGMFYDKIESLKKGF